MQTEPLQLQAKTANKRGNGLARMPWHARTSARRKDNCDTARVDEAFAVYSRIDAGAPGDRITAPFLEDRPAIFHSAARELVASISAQLASIERQRRELERLLDGAEVSAS